VAFACDRDRDRGAFAGRGCNRRAAGGGVDDAHGHRDHPRRDVPGLGGGRPGAHTAYVSNESGYSVSVIDHASNTVTATIPVGGSPKEAAVDPGTHTLYVTDWSAFTVSVISLGSQIPTTTSLSVNPGSTP
jgi:YVTN family beta-propeller protein